jgi:hypothetical protein
MPRPPGRSATVARTLLGLALLGALLAAPPRPRPALAGEDLVAATYARLDSLRDRKADQLRAYLDRIRDLAHQAASDQALTGFFRLKRQFLSLQAEAAPPPDAVAAVREAERGLQQHALARYAAFHDILFVDRSGQIFHTIRGERDRGQNLFRPPLRETALVRRLRDDPGAGFVDYEHYAASDEPSAFFVEPVELGGRRAGWLLLQATIAKINRIFHRGEALGRTGEVLLVNRERLLLTDSRFQARTSILRQHLSRANIGAKFAEGRGHKIVTDYRGERALTAFEVVPVMGSRWLLIAKIDEKEVITRAWRRRSLEPALLRAAARQRPAGVAAPRAVAAARRVDMDEFHRADPDQPLVTYGVSTCTAVLVGLPGRFAYLGHASPYDRIYGQGDIDLVGHMLGRVRRFEVYPSEVRQLRAVITAPHRRSAHGVIERLLDAGLFLDQITLVCDPDARRADVHHDPASGRTRVRWVGPQGSSRWVDARDVASLGQLARRLLDYPQAVRRADTAARPGPGPEASAAGPPAATGAP